MAVGFVSNIDDLIAFFFVGTTQREIVEDGVEAILETGVEKGWLKNRIYGMVLGASLSIVVLFCEELIPMFTAHEQKDFIEAGGAPCSILLMSLVAFLSELQWL